MPKKTRKLVFEDLTAMQDKWATGMSGRSAGPRQLTLLDILGRSSDDGQHPNNVVAKGPDVYGTQMMIELLGDLVIQSERVKGALLQAKESVILQDRDDAQAQLAKIIKKAGLIEKIVSSIAKDINDFSVDKPKK
tara:strand:+ start:631 stop:1035 length:405 start_codon:yes stop_codon:yes gene_type:complete